MIRSAFWNGIDFSGNFNRENALFNFEAQRVKNILPVATLGTLCFETSSDEYNYIFIHNLTNGTIYGTNKASILNLATTFLVFFNIDDTDFNQNTDVYFEVRSGADASDYTSLFSEIYRVKSPTYLTENRIAKLTAYNNDARRGFATSVNPAFGFFQTTGFNEDVFVNTKTEYEYSYNRKKILSSENNIAKRLTFVNLSMYQQNLLKWLCNCENLLIDGVQYELISDFTELLSDENSEVKDLRADFIPTNQSFFGNGSGIAPNNVFPTEFYMK
jgi:hypothetical protein